MDINLTPDQLNKIKKQISPEQFKKLNNVFSLLEGENPLNMQFKCINCNYQGSGADFQTEDMLACPKCKQSNLTVISDDNLDITINQNSQDKQIKPTTYSDNLGNSQNDLTANNKIKIVIAIIITAAIFYLIFNLTK